MQASLNHGVGALGFKSKDHTPVTDSGTVATAITLTAHTRQGTGKAIENGQYSLWKAKFITDKTVSRESNSLLLSTGSIAGQIYT